MKRTKIALLLAFLLVSVALMICFAISAAADGEYTVKVIVQFVDTDQTAGKVKWEISQSESVEIVESYEFEATLGASYNFIAEKSSEGYQFDGWTIKKTGNGASEERENPSKTYNLEVVSTYKSYTLTATFSPATYKITCLNVGQDGYDGPDYEFVGATRPTQHVYGKQTTLPIPVLTNGKETHTFVGWTATTQNGNTVIEYGKNAVLGASEYTDNIILKPKWEPNNFNVKRIDGYLKDGVFKAFPNGEVVGTAKYGSRISGNEFGEERSYRGYWFDTDSSYGQPLTVSDNETQNIVYRLYTAKEYGFTIRNPETIDDWQAPLKHVYGTDLYLTAPIREGYTFTGWTIDRSKDQNPQYQSAYDLKPQGNGTYLLEGNAFDSSTETTIILIAGWEANSYSVAYDAATLYGFDTGDKTRFPDTRIYNKAFALSAVPVREGYTFKGWHIKGTDAEDVRLAYTIAAETKPGDLTFEAIWEPKSYEVTFFTYVSENGIYTTEPGTFEKQKTWVVFGKKPASIYPPECFRYTFGGYLTEDGTLVFLADGSFNPEVGVWKLSEATTLYARWLLLEKESAPTLDIDYEKEILTGLTPGDYRISKQDGTSYSFRFHADGSFTGSERPNPVRISEFFGSTILVTRLGDGETTSDSDPQRIELTPRLDAPTEKREIIRVNTEEVGAIRLEMIDSDTIYEFAWTTEPVQNEDAITNWQDSSAFDDLEPDTLYYVYIRAKAKAGVYPHGNMQILKVTTSGETMDAFGILLVLGMIALLQIIAILILILRWRANRNAAIRYSFAFPLLMFALPTMVKSDRIAVIILSCIVVALQAVLTVLLLKTFVFKSYWTRPSVVPQQQPNEEQPLKETEPDAQEEADANDRPASEESKPEPESENQSDDTSAAQSVFASESVFYDPEKEETEGIPKGEVPPEE